MVIQGELRPISGELNGFRFDVEVPTRIAPPSFRPTPQLDFRNVLSFFRVEIPTPFPLQASTFPGLGTNAGATANCWFGPSDVVSEGAPLPPPDTLLVTYHGPNSPNEGPNIERYILGPFFEWLRVLTRQWWVGRSIEGVTGALHFIALLNKEDANVGSPTPVVRFTSAGPEMQPISNTTWIAAWERVFRSEIPPAEKVLEMDANFAIASREFRSGIILACGAIEAARDALLNRLGIKLSAMKTSRTDLLKHLSVGFEKVLGASLKDDRPDLFDLATAFWCARGEAAHGRPVRWRLTHKDVPIEDVEFGTISDNLAHILRWIGAKAPSA